VTTKGNLVGSSVVLDSTDFQWMKWN